jgi:hypothetical protein
MAYAEVRDYQCTSPSSTTTPAGVWAHSKDTIWQIRPELWPYVSAFLIQRPYAPASLITVVSEVALLMENTNWRPGVPLSWSTAAMSCPSHMSRFLTESLGLCVSVLSASAYGWNPFLAILDADRLPKNSPLYVATGSRPDFVAQSTIGWHGIEARGRGASGPVRIQRPVAVQEPKLVGMHQWAAKLAGPPPANLVPSWSMSWAWITDVKTVVDHFDPGHPVKLTPSDEQAIWTQMDQVAAALTATEDLRIHHVDALDRQVSVVSRSIQDNPPNGSTSWLTVASWTKRLTLEELQERRDVAINRDSARLRESFGGLNRASVGSYMATAITDRQPTKQELGLLIGALAADAVRNIGRRD